MCRPVAGATLSIVPPSLLLVWGCGRQDTWGNFMCPVHHETAGSLSFPGALCQAPKALSTSLPGSGPPEVHALGLHPSHSPQNLNQVPGSRKRTEVIPRQEPGSPRHAQGTWFPPQPQNGCDRRGCRPSPLPSPSLPSPPVSLQSPPWPAVGLRPPPHLRLGVQGGPAVVFLFLVRECYYGYLSITDVSLMLFLYRNLQKDIQREYFGTILKSLTLLDKMPSKPLSPLGMCVCGCPHILIK